MITKILILVFVVTVDVGIAFKMSKVIVEILTCVLLLLLLLLLMLLLLLLYVKRKPRVSPRLGTTSKSHFPWRFMRRRLEAICLSYGSTDNIWDLEEGKGNTSVRIMSVNIWNQQIATLIQSSKSPLSKGEIYGIPWMLLRHESQLVGRSRNNINSH